MIILEQHEHEQYLKDEFNPPWDHYDKGIESPDHGDKYYIVRTTAEHAIVQVLHWPHLCEHDIEITWDVVFKQMFGMPNMSIVVVQSDFGGQPFRLGDHVLFVGEIKNMRGHCVVATKDGRILWGYHTDDFRAARKHEL
jgi:hypothetical protein